MIPENQANFTMQLVIPPETQPGEDRVSATPETVKKLVRPGADVVVESGAGAGAGISDADYEAAGASIGSDRSALLGSADMVLRLRKPEMDEISQLKAGCIHVSYLDPFNEKDLIKAFASHNVIYPVFFWWGNNLNHGMPKYLTSYLPKYLADNKHVRYSTIGLPYPHDITLLPSQTI